MLYRDLYDIRYIEIFLNIMKLVLEKMFGKSRVRYIMGSLYRDQTVYSFKKLHKIVKILIRDSQETKRIILMISGANFKMRYLAIRTPKSCGFYTIR